jgi:hypothetical protein
LARAQKRSADALDPSWGEPELLMSLAWSQLNRASPDRRAAEEYAKQALALVPHWHYVRDILLPQIRRNPLGPGLPAAQRIASVVLERRQSYRRSSRSFNAARNVRLTRNSVPSLKSRR